jgi:hypothetical protein
MGLTILVCGDRHWDSRRTMENFFKVFKEFPDVTIVSGGCSGADDMAARLASEMGMNSKIYPADWTTHGKAAGPIRNQQMLDTEHPDVVFAFHDHIEESKGTVDMIMKARAAGVPVALISRRVVLTEVP